MKGHHIRSILAALIISLSLPIFSTDQNHDDLWSNSFNYLQKIKKISLYKKEIVLFLIPFSYFTYQWWAKKLYLYRTYLLNKTKKNTQTIKRKQSKHVEISQSNNERLKTLISKSKTITQKINQNTQKIQSEFNKARLHRERLTQKVLQGIKNLENLLLPIPECDIPAGETS